MKKLRENSGYLCTLILCTGVVAFWITAMPLKYRFTDSYNIFTSMGQLSSLIGIVLYSLSLVLSARLAVFEDMFGGMNKVYRAHHIIGGTAFLLFMIHPISLAVARISISLKYASDLLLPGEDWTINMGIIAFLFLMLLLLITYYMDLPYQIWRFTHKFMGVAFIFGVIHAFFVPSDISRYAPLKYYLLAVVSVGIFFYLYRTVFGRIFVKRTRFVVENVNKLKDNILEIEMEPETETFTFEPGQYVFISFKDSLIGKEVHPFSLSSAPNDKTLKLTIKSLGDFTKSLENLKAGDTALVEGPYGRFSYQRYPGNQIWIAGGIGITPFISMVRSFTEHLAIKIDLYYCLKDENEAVCLDELSQISGRRNNFRVIPVYSKIHGRLTVEGIKKISGDIVDREIFLCGPPPMMLSLKKQLIKEGVTRERIHSEEFGIL